MRILLVSEDVPAPSMGGLAKHVLLLARCFNAGGHQADLLGNAQVALADAGAEGEFGGRFYGELDGHLSGWKEMRLGALVPARRSWIARRFARCILRHAPRYDVVHYHGHAPNVAAFVPRTVNFVQTRHDQGSDCARHTRFRDGAPCTATAARDCASCFQPQANALQRALTSSAVTRLRREVALGMRRHKTLFVSAMLQQNLQRTFGAGPWGATLHNFVDRDAVDAARALVPHSSARSRINVLVAGKLTAAKGVSEFLRHLLPAMPATMQVTVAGDGPQEGALRAAFGRHPRLQFRGWCAHGEVLRLAAAAHAIAVPSLWEEPFGSSILEGLLMGRPTWALARGGTPEMRPFAHRPGQLRLFDTLDAMAADLAATQDFPDYGPAPDGLGGVHAAAARLLEIYRLPPGPLKEAA